MRRPHPDTKAAVEGWRRADRRAEILAAARSLFAEHGNVRATMADIAAEIGVAEGTLYLYFDSKKSLVAAVAADWFEEIVTATEREAHAIRNPLDLLRFLIQRHLDVIIEHKEIYLTLMRETRAGEGYASSPVRDINRRYTGLLRSLFETACENRTGEPDARTMRDLVYGGVEHVAWTALLGNVEAIDTARKADEIAASFARAFGLTATAPDEIEQRLKRIEAKLKLK